MNKPEISPDFTIDDIHKIREYHHGQTKDMSTAEMKAYYKMCADTVAESIERKRKLRLAN